MPAKSNRFASSCKALPARVLACLLSVSLVVALYPMQGWSDESGLDTDPGQVTEVVPMASEPEAPQLTKSVPMDEEPEAPQLTKAVPLSDEPTSSDAPMQDSAAKTAKVTFVISDESTASWPDSTTDDRTVEVPVGEPLGALVPPTPISSDDSLVFEGWQTEDFETIDEKTLHEKPLEGDAILYAVFSSAPANGGQCAKTTIASGAFGECFWGITDDSLGVTLAIYAGTLGSGVPPWISNSSYQRSITNVVINSGVKMEIDTGALFDGCSNLKSILGLNYKLDVSEATRLDSMFKDCSSLTSLDISAWNTSHAWNMDSMFSGCSSLTSLNISSWNTSNAWNMDSMFSGCSSLTSLNISSWDTSKVLSMDSMFSGCQNLTSLDLSSWNTSNVWNMKNMFSGCSSLTSLNISSWDTSKVQYMNYMFEDGQNLTSLDLSSWNTSDLRDVSYMFCRCSKLSSLNLSSWNMSRVTDMSYMFYDCKSLEVIPASLTFGATTVDNKRLNMFKVTGSTVVTTYNGSDTEVKGYDWPAANRALYGTPLTGSVSVAGDAGSVGQTLTASAKPDNACRNAQQVFKWYRGSSASDTNPTYVSTGTTYTTTDADIGKYIFCKMTDGLGAYIGTLSAAAVGPVTVPFTATVTVKGAAVVDQTLTADVVDPTTSSVSYKWQRADKGTANWADIQGATGKAYKLDQADFGKIIRCVVTPTPAGYTGTAESSATDPVKGVLTGTVSLSGTAKVGSTLTAIVDNPSSGVVPFTYKWYRSFYTSSGSELISGETSSSYTLQDADKGLYVSCVVSVADTTAWTGSIQSGWVGRVPKDFSATVTISGDKRTDSILTADVTYSNAGSETLAYQWYRSSSPSGEGWEISGERSATYQQTADDRNKYLSCKVWVRNADAWTGSVLSGWYGPSLTAFSASVTVKGTAVVGRTLTAEVANPTTSSVSYKWQRADKGTANWVDIAGATKNTYPLVEADFGKIIRCKVTPTPAGYTGTAESSATDPVKGSFTAQVQWAGTAKVGSTRTVIVSNPSSGQVPFTYKWYRSSTPSGYPSGDMLVATTSTNAYPLQDADKGMYIWCEVSVADTNAWTGSVFSGWSVRVLKDFSATVTVSGDERTDSILTAKVSDSNASGEALTYQWYRSTSPSGDGTAISGATSATYKQTADDRNKYLSCVVSVANADANAWTGSVRSNWKGPSLTTFAASVSVSGSAVVGQTLTAKVESPNASSYSYQWQRAPKDSASWTYILNATGSTYELGQGDFGQTIRCVVKATPAGYTGEVVSNVTDPVKGKLAGTVSLEGTAKVGSTLTAKVNNPSSGQVAFAYKWYRSSTGMDAGELISGEMSNSYELKDADKGMFVSCEVSVADTAAWTGSIRSGWSARVLKDFTGTVTLSGDERTGSELRADVTSSNASGEALSYRWYRSTSPSGDGTLISGANANTYQQTADDRNKYLSCVVSVDNTTAWTGSIRSDWKGPSLTTFTAGVSLSGTTVVGQSLKASVSDPNASSYSYKWQRTDKDTANWADIPNATADTYELVQDDFRKIVRCVVAASVAGYTGEVASDATATIQGVLDGKVAVSGNFYANQKLTASVEGLSQGATAAYRWYIATNAAGTDRTLINGATSSELDLSPLRAQVVGKYVICEVYDSSNAYVNAVSSSVVGPIGIAWGTSGPNTGGCIWTIDAAGAMTIAPAANGQGSLGELKASSAPWDDFVAQVKSASIASGVKSGASLAGMFGSCRQMTSVDLSGLDATDATDLSSMFYACSSLTTVKDLDALKMAKPTNLGSMFYGCSKLAALDLSGFAAGTATDLSAMFWGCSQLSDLKLPAGFVGEKCTTVVNMFYGCNALGTIPAEFGFGSNESIQTDGCFTVTGSDPLATTYLGDDLNVASYDWQGSNRSLVVWKLSGEATITGGDDPIADNELTASVTFMGPAAGLEDGAAYQWYTASSADDANPVAIDRATSATYSPRKADVGKFLVCLVSAPSDSGAQGALRAATTKAVRAPQVWATVPSRTQVYVDSQGRASVPTTSAYALGALDSEGKATEGDIQLVGVTLTLSDASYPGGSWTLGTPGDDKIKASTFIENKAFATPGTACTVADAPAIAPGSNLPLEWEASFKNDIGPKLTSLLTAADGEGARYGDVEFKVAWKPRA